jgi:hypothetical protein
MGAPRPLAACNNGITDLLRTSFKKILVFFKANVMEHSIAQAIRTVGAKICRRLDVLIAAAGQPAVEDIEGTPAPRKPLATGAAKKNQDPCAASPQPQEAQNIGAKRGRGRPPKNQATPTPGGTLEAPATPEIDSLDDTCEASFFIIMCVSFFH